MAVDNSPDYVELTQGAAAIVIATPSGDTEAASIPVTNVDIIDGELDRNIDAVQRNGVNLYRDERQVMVLGASGDDYQLLFDASDWSTRTVERVSSGGPVDDLATDAQISAALGQADVIADVWYDGDLSGGTATISEISEVYQGDGLAVGSTIAVPDSEAWDLGSGRRHSAVMLVASGEDTWQMLCPSRNISQAELEALGMP